jgi:hypothetical protein
MQESNEEVEASLILTDSVMNIDGPNLDLAWTTVHTVRRKAAKRSEKWYQKTTTPVSIPSRKKRRLEDPLLPLRRSSRRLIATSSIDASTPPSDATVVASTSRQRTCQTKTQLSPVETIEAQLDGGGDDDVDDLSGASRETRLSELAEYCKLYGHCNVPSRYSENTKLGTWVMTQRRSYKLHQEGKTSHMTLSRIQELASLGFEWDSHSVTWEERLSQLGDYRKVHEHCNVPRRYSENTKLSFWVMAQRKQYKLRQEGKKSFMTPFRIQELASLGFEWDCSGVTWEARLSELAEYRKLYGHCSVPKLYSENKKLGIWVMNQRRNYKLHQEGKTSRMTLSRIQELASLGFEWDCSGVTWEARLSELAEYRKVHKHCNVPKRYSEKTKLGLWVMTQRKQYRLRREGKKSCMTPFRIQALERMGFEWDSHGATWGDRLTELADYCKIHGHCNVPRNYSENSKLGHWVRKQRYQYGLHEKGKKSEMTPFRIQELERMGFE